jgi:hypothetical protein
MADELWHCEVSLRFSTHHEGGSVREVVFGPSIFHKSEVTERIRRAQRAILSTQTDPDVFLNDDESSRPPREFSSDCIVLKIAGRDVTNLIFVDLPGQLFLRFAYTLSLTHENA